MCKCFNGNKNNFIVIIHCHCHLTACQPIWACYAETNLYPNLKMIKSKVCIGDLTNSYVLIRIVSRLLHNTINSLAP